MNILERSTPESVEMPTNEIADRLEAVEFFAEFSRVELETLAEAFEAVRYEHEAVTARAAVDPSELAVIVDGGIRIIIDGDDTGVVLPPGQLYGEFSLTDGSICSATLVADGETRLLRLPEQAFHGLFRTTPDIARRLLQRAARTTYDNLRETNKQAVEETAKRMSLEQEVEFLKERLAELEAEQWGGKAQQ